MENIKGRGERGDFNTILTMTFLSWRLPFILIQLPFSAATSFSLPPFRKLSLSLSLCLHLFYQSTPYKSISQASVLIADISPRIQQSILF